MPRQLPETRASLLWRIRDPQDQFAWQAFVAIYSPVIYAFATKKGLDDADAADIVQRVLIEVMGSIPKFEYDDSKGRFRSWLFTLTRYQVAKFYDRQSKQVQGAGGSGMQAQIKNSPVDDPLEHFWNHEYESHLFQWAVQQVRSQVEEKTWQAFWLTAIEGKSAKETAAAIGISPGAVWIAKSRVTSRLKNAIDQFEDGSQTQS